MSGHAGWFALLRQLGALVSVRRYRPACPPLRYERLRAEAWRQLVEDAERLDAPADSTLAGGD